VRNDPGAAVQCTLQLSSTNGSEDMMENLRMKTGYDMMKVDAFWSLVTLSAVVFIGKSWVVGACLYHDLSIMTDHLKRSTNSMSVGGTLSYYDIVSPQRITKMHVLESPYPFV
jgi:hypothetical protein